MACCRRERPWSAWGGRGVLSALTGRWVLHALTVLLIGLTSTCAMAETPDDWDLLAQRLANRGEVLERQQREAEAKLREQALLAYRLERRRELAFVSSPESRLGCAQAADLALTSLSRGLAEARILANEAERVRSELVALGRARSQRAADSEAGIPARELSARHFVRPVRGAVVGEPGIRRDSPTGTELRRDGIELLARLDEPVRAVAAGVIRRVEALPQGGYAVVTEHPGGWVSVLSGLRDVAVTSGEPVAVGQSIGLAGRNLDGAAVLTMELRHNRRTVDPRRVVAGLPRP